MTYLHTQKKRFKKYDGFYAVATNLEDSAKDILNVANPENMCYMSTYTSSDLCAALNAITGLGLDEKYYEPKDLNKKIRNILKQHFYTTFFRYKKWWKTC